MWFYFALKLLPSFSTTSVTDPCPPYKIVDSEYKSGAYNEQVRLFVFCNWQPESLVPEFIWMSAAGKLHCFKPHTHISNTSSCSYQQAAAPCPGVAPGICPCGAGPYQQGVVSTDGLHVGSLDHFFFFCKNYSEKEWERAQMTDGNFWWSSIVVVSFCGLDIAGPARVSGLLGLWDHLRQR